MEGAVSAGFIFEGKLEVVWDQAFGLGYARGNDPQKFNDCGSGYLVQAPQSYIQQIFFKKGHFEQDMLDYATKIKETGTVADFVSLNAIIG